MQIPLNQQLLIPHQHRHMQSLLHHMCLYTLHHHRHTRLIIPHQLQPTVHPQLTLHTPRLVHHLIHQTLILLHHNHTLQYPIQHTPHHLHLAHLIILLVKVLTLGSILLLLHLTKSKLLKQERYFGTEEKKENL